MTIANITSRPYAHRLLSLVQPRTMICFRIHVNTLDDAGGNASGEQENKIETMRNLTSWRDR